MLAWFEDAIFFNFKIQILFVFSLFSQNDIFTMKIKELRNYSRKLSLRRSQKQAKHNEKLKLLFFKIKLPFDTSLVFFISN